MSELGLMVYSFIKKQNLVGTISGGIIMSREHGNMIDATKNLSRRGRKSSWILIHEPQETDYTKRLYI